VESSTIIFNSKERDLNDQDENTEDSVRRCLTNEQSLPFKFHHYFDYIAGTSAGGYIRLVS
jgi:patatin-like phospholipase/acyl hydrolase